MPQATVDRSVIPGASRAVRWLALSTLASVVACSLAVGSSRKQCSTNEDCAQHGLGANPVCVANVCAEAAAVNDTADGAVEDAAPVDPVWGCIGKVPPAPAPDPSTPVHFFARYVGLISSSPLAGLSIKPCEENDPTCAGYQGQPVSTNSNGQADVPIYNGFRGYLEIGPSADVPNLMPTLSYIQPVPDKTTLPETPRPFTWVLLTKSDFDFLTGSSGKTVYPQLGHIIFGSRNCEQIRPPNTIVRAEPIAAETFAFYTDTGGLPSLTQGKTGPPGNGGYVNLPPGYITIHYSRDTGEPIGSYSVLVRAGTITQLVFGPTVDIKVEP